MRRHQIVLLLTALLLLASVGLASAETGYGVTFASSITYQNVSPNAAHVTFYFYNENSGTPIQVDRDLPANAGSSLSVASLTGTEALPANFMGSAVLSSTQNVVATLVQIPQPTTGTVKNRPLSNGFSQGAPQVLLASVLKNQFNTNSKFSIQNASDGAVDITVKFYAVGQTTPTFTATATAVPAGAAKYWDAGTINELGASFDGSAVVTAVVSGQSTPANVVGTVLELQTNNVGVRAFEGVPSTAAANTVYVATALCNLSGMTSAYAVQNTSSTNAAAVTVTYSNGATQSDNIPAGGKKSFSSCTTGVPAGFSGAAKITSTGASIVVIGKVGGAGRYTAFLGETSGAARLALPYVRWTSDANFATGNFQRAQIAIQNIGGAAVNNVKVHYLDKNGTEVGTHTIATIGAGEKANSNPSNAGLTEFGVPASNPGGGFGGAAIIEGPAGSQLIAVARISSQTPAGVVAEDYNATAAPLP